MSTLELVTFRALGRYTSYFLDAFSFNALNGLCFNADLG
jgi:hypothetical protein